MFGSLGFRQFLEGRVPGKLGKRQSRLLLMQFTGHHARLAKVHCHCFEGRQVSRSPLPSYGPGCSPCSALFRKFAWRNSEAMGIKMGTAASFLYQSGTRTTLDCQTLRAPFFGWCFGGKSKGNLRKDDSTTQFGGKSGIRFAALASGLP